MVKIKVIYGIQEFDSIISRYFCTRFISLILKSEIFLDYTNSFSPNGYENNDKIILKYFQKLKR